MGDPAAPSLSNEQAQAELQARYDRFAAAELRGQSTFEPLSHAKQYFRQRKLEAALALGAFAPGAAVLEIGCSIGQFSFPLARQGYRVVGLDLSAHSIELAKRRAATQGVHDIEFAVGDAQRLAQFPADHFEGVVSFSTLRYVPDLLQALREIHRVLRSGGRAVIDFPNRWCPWFYLKPWLGSEVHPHDHWFGAGPLLNLVTQAGFVRVRMRQLLFTPTVAPDQLLGLFRAADWLGERLPLIRRFAGIIMVAAEKP